MEIKVILCCLCCIVITVYITACTHKKKKEQAPVQTMQPTQLPPDTLKDSLADAMQKIYPPPAIGIKKIGYLLDFRSPQVIPSIRYKQCNVIVFAFAHVNKKGLYLRYPHNLTAISKKAKEAGCKFLRVVSASHSMFKYVTAEESRRRLLINQLMQALQTYRLDGLDMNWEFPSIKDKTNEAFTLFLKELSDSCHTNARYYLSCAVSPGVNGGRRSSAIDTELLTGDWVDWFNIMVYDDFSEIHPYHHHSDINMAITSFKYWRQVRKMKKEKCVMGLPLYGRPSGIKQLDRVKTYAAILQNGGSPYKDSAVIKIDTAKTKDSLTQYTIYYDGIKTIRKKAKGAVKYGGGIMFWEIGQDVHSKYSLINAAVSVADTAGQKRTGQ